MKYILSVFIVIFLFAGQVSAVERVDIVPLQKGLGNGTVTVTTSATAIPTTALAGRKCISIINISANDIFIGNSSVTTANGYQLYVGNSISIDAGDATTIYGISTTNSEVRYLEAR